MSDLSNSASTVAIIVNSLSLWNMNVFSPRTNEEKPLSFFFSENTSEKSDIAETKLVSSLMFTLFWEYSLTNIFVPSFERM